MFAAEQPDFNWENPKVREAFDYAIDKPLILKQILKGQGELLQNQVLWANQVRPGGLGVACRKSRPLIFLNACEVGRPGAGLAAVGGFAASFIASDAGAVIAPLWAVDDRVAHQVAVTFYDTVKKKPVTPFADLLRDLRAKAYADGGEDSYAAYCFYGDPHACAAHQ